MRIFLRNYLRDGEHPVNINDDKELNLIASNRALFDKISGLESSLLTTEESASMRPLVYERIVENLDNDVCFKIHDAYSIVAPNLPITSFKGTKGALYLLRNPLDVAISWSHYIGISTDDAITAMGSEDHSLSETKGGIINQLPQRLFSWSRHVKSWVDTPRFPVVVIRFEDMKAHFFTVFERVIRFLGLPFEEGRLKKAVSFSDFNELKRQEKQHIFKEKFEYNRCFFREGKVGGWKNVLTSGQVQRVVADHEKVMSRFGYLDDAKAWLAEREQKSCYTARYHNQ